MRNICNVDITKNTYELGYTNESKCNNEISLLIRVSNIVDPYLEFTKTNGDIYNTETLAIENEEINYTIPLSYYLTSGTLKVRVRGKGYDSDYIVFTIPNILTSSDDIMVKIENNEYVIKKINVYNYSDIPIATKTSLGGIIVGDNLEIDSNGVLSATGGGNVNLLEITNDEIDALWAED